MDSARRLPPQRDQAGSERDTEQQEWQGEAEAEGEADRRGQQCESGTAAVAPPKPGAGEDVRHAGRQETQAHQL